MDNLSLIYENKIHGPSLVRENILNDIRYYTELNNYKQVNSLLECLTPSEISILIQEGTINEFSENPSITLEQVQYLFESGQLSESQYETFLELFGGLGNIAKGIGGGLKRGAQQVGNAVRSGAQQVGQGVQNVGNAVRSGAQQVGQGVQNVGKAVRSGAQQVGQNVQNMYRTGENERQAAKQVQLLINSYNDINTIINNIKQLNPDLGNFIGKDPTLSHLQKVIRQVSTAASNKAQAAQQQGMFGGVANAVRQGYNQ